MTTEKKTIFNRAYEGSSMYYGWEVRDEFVRHVEPLDLTCCTALDLGAGEGRYSIYLADRGCRVVAVDFAESGLKKITDLSRQKNLNVVAVQSDLKTHVFEEETYDIVVGATILDHLDDKTRQRTINGMKAALKPRGMLYVNVFTTCDPGYKTHDKKDHTLPGVSDTSSGIEHYFETNELKTCFSDLNILYYYEGLEEDLSHGRPHFHGWAGLIGKKDPNTSTDGP